MEVKLVEYQLVDCPVVFNGKVYQLCFVFDGGLVLKDDITGVHCFPSDNKINEHIKNVKHISCNGHIQYGDTVRLQQMLDAKTELLHQSK